MADQLPISIPAPISRAQQTAILNLTRRAARAEILPRFRKLDASDISAKTSPTDLVTAADTAAEAMIARGLQIAFPSALVIGEEAAARDPAILDGIAEAELCILIDPVDGTWNFANGLPVFGTMIAACRFGWPVWGMIYDPMGDDAYIAAQDAPAMAGRRTLRTAAEKPLNQMIGYMHLGLMPQADRALASARLPRFAFVTNLRCSAHEYRLLAQGAVDFVLSGKMTPWDHAAGVLLCQRAGGHAAMLDGSDYTAALPDSYLLSASSKAVWDAVASQMQDLLSDE
ncbi:MAG: inositol monophosphatase [Pseudomonadota bacterium]